MQHQKTWVRYCLYPISFPFIDTKSFLDEQEYLENVNVNFLPKPENQCDFHFEFEDDKSLEHTEILTEEETSRIYLQKLKKLRVLLFKSISLTLP